MTFTLYGAGFRSLALEALLAEQRDHGMLYARAEQSGSEGCYCEVARWNESRGCYQRYAFAKFFGGEVRKGLNACQTAERVADDINAAGYVDRYQPLLHRLDNWSGEVLAKAV